jgi:hypothetical protein
MLGIIDCRIEIHNLRLQSSHRCRKRALLLCTDVEKASKAKYEFFHTASAQ